MCCCAGAESHPGSRPFGFLAHTPLAWTCPAAIPFFGDFVALVGALGFVPLDFILPCLFYNHTQNPKWPQRILNYVIATILAGVATVGFIGACRWIHVHLQTYHFFASEWLPPGLYGFLFALEVVG